MDRISHSSNSNSNLMQQLLSMSSTTRPSMGMRFLSTIPPLIIRFVIHCQYIEPRDANNTRRRENRDFQPNLAPVYPTPQPPARAHIDYPEPPTALPGKAVVPQPAPLQAAAPLNPAMEVTRYNTAAGGEFTIDAEGRLTRREQMEEEQRTGRARSPASQNPLLVQSAIQIAINDNVLEDSNASKNKSGVMAYVKTHPQLVIDYSDI